MLLQSDTEASLRDAHSTISKLEKEIATLRRQKSEGSQATKESRDLRRQLDEMKDRNTALEQQMMEYSTTVEDQTKVNYTYYAVITVGPVLIVWFNVCVYAF